MHKTFLIPILLTAFLYGCVANFKDDPLFRTTITPWALITVQQETVEASYTQTPYVITATPLQTVVPTLQIATTTPTPDCPVYPPITVGYIPDLDLGGKQSVVSVIQNCSFLSIVGGGWSMDISPDGCTFYADKGYPCDFSVNENGNIRAYYHNKVGRDFLICLAVDSKSFNVDCQ
jgi:hypothetical protein